MKKNSLVSAAIILFLAGCCILPEGTPPEGNITENTSVKKMNTPAETADYLVSSLTVALLSNCAGEKIQIKSDEATSGAAARVLIDSGRITGNKLTYTDSEWVLKSMYRDKKIQMQLLNNGKIIWSETVESPFDPAQMR